jgi:predicted transcriptional regulator of viral defense system
MAKLVNWQCFEAKLKDKRVLLFSPLDITRIFGVSKIAATFLVHRYTKRGFIVRAKRGLYGFVDALPPEYYVANKLYEPSYVSLESALSYHRVIPETVYEITSVTSKNTRRFETLGKVFTYHTIKKAAFTGYNLEKRNNFSFIIAEPEKAFVDTLYLRMLNGEKPLRRFNKEKLNKEKAFRYANVFGNDKIVSIVKRALL